jgi:signal transduction histidine kinase
MTLFRKTLLFFIGVIVFQSVLTMLLVTNVTRRTNLSDARRELEDEAAILYDGFNSWKRQMWISLIAAANDPSLARAVSPGRPVPLKERLLEAKVDAVVVRGASGRVLGFDQTVPGSFELKDLDVLSNEQPHPYIELLMISGSLDLVGVASLGPGDSPLGAVRDGGAVSAGASAGAPAGAARADIFFIKRVDDEFAAQLVRNRKSQVAILQGTTVLAAAGGQVPADGRSTPAFFDPGSMGSAYQEIYDQRMGGGSCSAAFQRLGRLDHEQEGDELFLATFISNGPYDQKLVVLDRTILVVSLAAALLTVILSLFLSRNITRPIAQLLAAMGRVGGGVLETTLPARGGYEISRLFGGFNEMAGELSRNRAEVTRALRETVLLKEYNEKIVDSIRAGIAIVNSDLVVEKANDAFISAFALDRARVIGAPLTWLDIGIVDEEVVERILGVFRHEAPSTADIRRARGGRVYEIRLYPFYSSEPGGVKESSGCVFMTEDISAKTELEQRIFQAEKLAAVSMLSAGMAHEINNPLGSILTNVQNLIKEETDPSRRVSLSWIEQETRRIARIVQGLLHFASPSSPDSWGADVNAVITEVVALLGASVAREGRIRIDTRLEPRLPPTALSADELRQVVINLLSNSLQAISGTGRILVSTFAPRGGRLTLAVADSGKGIARLDIPRIFDPFFTTKANGEGTGLGLSVVYGIVTRYGGTIAVKSREGTGARFCVGLPTRETEKP